MADQSMVLLTADQLRALVSDAVRDALANSNGVAEYMTLQEVAQMMKVTTRSVRNWVKDAGLPALRAGADYRFRRESVARWLEDQAAKPGGHVSRHTDRLKRAK